MQRDSSVSSHFIFQAPPPPSPQLDPWKPQSPRKTPANPDTRLSVKPSLNHLRAPSSRGPKSLAGRPDNKLPLWLVLVCPAPLAKTWAPPMNSCLEQRILPHRLRPPYTCLTLSPLLYSCLSSVQPPGTLLFLCGNPN